MQKEITATTDADARVITVVFARPDGHVSAGTWTPSSGGDLFAMIDESVADDSDYSASELEIIVNQP